MIYFFFFCNFSLVMVNIMQAFPSIEKLSFDLESVALLRVLEFSRYTKLKSLHLSCSYLNVSVLQTLNEMTTLEELSIYIRSSCNRMSDELKKFSKMVMQNLVKLRSIKIEFARYGLEWDDVISLVKELPCLTHLCLIGNKVFLHKHIEDVVSISPDLCCLKLCMPINSFNAKFYSTLVRERSRWYHKSAPLVIHLAKEKLNIIRKQITDYVVKERYISLRPLTLNRCQ